jgi:hypothetical protein
LLFRVMLVSPASPGSEPERVAVTGEEADVPEVA